VPKRAAITGASGLIGRQVVAPLLERGFEVHLLARDPATLEILDPGIRSRCRAHRVDLLDPAATAACLTEVRPTHVAHLAWHGEHRSRWTSPANLDWAAATLRLVTAFAVAGGRRMVVVGSCAEYLWGPEPLVENKTPLAPASVYGHAKAAVHCLLEAARPELGVSLGWAHVFFCYGPGEAKGRLLHDVISGLLAGREVAVGVGEERRDLMHTEDIGRAVAMFLDSDLNGALNVASGTEIAMRDYVMKAAGLLGHPELIKFRDGVSPGSQALRVVADVTRLTKELGFRPKYDLDSGLRQTIDWYRETVP